MVLKFCPNCGVKLPETTGTDPDKLNSETASEASKLGFDSGGPLLTMEKVGGDSTKKKKGGVGSFVGVVMVVILVTFLVVMFMKGGAVRNCIGSINGAPECSDCSNSSMPTTVNGKSVGNCTANPGTGEHDDQCTLNCP
jgi:hypothetical protein